MDIELSGKGKADIQMASTGAVTLSVGAPRGTGYYPALTGKPSIEGVTLVGDKSFEELGLGGITPQEIDRLIYG